MEHLEQEDGQALSRLEIEIVTVPDGPIAITSLLEEAQAAANLDLAEELLALAHEAFDPLVVSAKANYDAAKAQRAKYTDKLEAASKALRAAIAAYRQKIAADIRKQQEAISYDAHMEAEYLREIGHEEEAQVVELSVPVVQAPQAAPGLGVRENWSAVVTSMKQLTKAVADGVAPEESLLPNMAFLNGEARRGRKNLRIPGVIAKPTPTTVRKKKGK